MDSPCRQCHQPGLAAHSCHNPWTIPRPAATTAPALAPATAPAPDVSAANPPGAVDASADREVEMSDEEFNPPQSDAESDALVSMDEVASGD